LSVAHFERAVKVSGLSSVEVGALRCGRRLRYRSRVVLEHRSRAPVAGHYNVRQVQCGQPAALRDGNRVTTCQRAKNRRESGLASPVLRVHQGQTPERQAIRTLLGDGETALVPTSIRNAKLWVRRSRGT
jgi:hypothetical protein